MTSIMIFCATLDLRFLISEISFRVKGALVITAVNINCLYRGILTIGSLTFFKSRHLFRIFSKSPNKISSSYSIVSGEPFQSIWNDLIVNGIIYNNQYKSLMITLLLLLYFLLLLLLFLLAS